MNPLRLLRVMLAIAACALIARAQAPARIDIVGTVRDDSTGAFLENVNVFVARTTLGTSTDAQGRFEIRNIPQGSYDIVASRVGYEVRTIQVTLFKTDTSRQMKIKLKPSPIHIGEVVVSASDPLEWKKQLEKFQTTFLGTTPFSRECTIKNPEVLDFGEEDEVFTAKASAPLEIENEALGYRVHFIMTMFRVEYTKAFLGTMNARSEHLLYDGSPEYFELTPQSPEQAARWKANRLKAYEGSVRHFFISLVKDRWEDDGYVVTLTPEIVLENNTFNCTLITPENVDLILSPTQSPTYKSLHFTGFLEVQYTPKGPEPGYDSLKKIGSVSQVSWLQLNRDAITINSRGIMDERFATNWYGYWSWLRFADSLPLDYSPAE
jgi:hypothetical protein